MLEGKKTSLYEKHIEIGGKVIDFSGFLLPVQYTGIIEEHQAVRNDAGMFDVSHMGEVEVKGEGATAFLQMIFTNDLSLIENGQVQYGMMCYENGTVVDDLLIYKYSDTHYLMVINAGNIDKDIDWIMRHSVDFDVTVTHLSDQISEIALQGPKAEALLQTLTKELLSDIKFFHFKTDVKIDGKSFIVSRTGYTGEDGFEIYGDHEAIIGLWDKLLEVGKPFNLLPCGLGARDTLRFEASLPLYGNEISNEITPLEAGLGFFVKLGKADFIGKTALQSQKEQGLKRKLVGFEMEKGIPRHGYDVIKDETLIGVVTTGYYSPTLEKNIGLAMIASEHAMLDTTFKVQVRKKQLPAKIISKKFYQKQYKK